MPAGNKNLDSPSDSLATLPAVSEETEKLLKELQDWADQKRGRRAELARILGVDRSSITEWFQKRSEPSWETGLKIQAFLRKQRRRKQSPPPGQP